MTTTVFSLLMLGVLLNAGAQLLLKAGVNHMPGLHFQFQLSPLFQLMTQVMINPYIMLGLFSYGISVIVWMVVLSKVEVSLAYPMLSLGFIVNAIAAYYLFDESLTAFRLGGIMIIIVGVFIVARS